MRATIERLVCRHRYERRAVVIDRNVAADPDGVAGPDEVVERCPKCGKERFRAPAGS